MAVVLRGRAAMLIADLMPLSVGYLFVLLAVGHVPIMSEVLHDLDGLDSARRQPEHQERHQQPLQDPEEPRWLPQDCQDGWRLHGHGPIITRLGFMASKVLAAGQRTISPTSPLPRPR
jgi:hypothetical protein